MTDDTMDDPCKHVPTPADDRACRPGSFDQSAFALPGFVPCPLHSLFLNAIPLPVFVKNCGGGYTDCNEAFETFLGRPRSAIVGLTVFDMGPRDVAVKYKEKDDELFASPGTQVYDWRVVRKNGEVRHVVFHKSTIRDGTGAVIGLVGVIQDDTERNLTAKALKESEDALRRAHDDLEVRVKERTEELRQVNASLKHSLDLERRTGEALRESEERFRNIVGSAPLGMHFYELMPEDMLVFAGANPAADLILGVPNDRFVGMPIEKAFPALVGTEIPTRYREVAMRGGVWRTEQIECEDESMKGVFEVAVFRVAPRRIAVVFNDITERQRTREALEERTRQLAESEQKYRTVADFTYDWEDWRSPDGKFRYVSPACERITGYSAAEVMARPGLLDEVLILADDLPALVEHRRRVFRPDAPPAEVEFRIRTKSGEMRWIHRVCQSVFDRADNWLGRRGTNHDVTQRKLAEERDRRLREDFMKADKMIALGTLVAGVAHEVNNPNQFITLNIPILEALLNKAMPELDRKLAEEGEFFIGKAKYSEMRGRVPELLAGMRKGVDRIKHIVDDLKHFARDERPEMAKDVDVVLVVQSAISLMDSMIRKCTDRFAVAFASGVPPVCGNFQRLEQVTLNLLQNACLALPSSSLAVEVTVRLSVDKAWVEIVVRDEGVGMAPEVVRQIGNPFFTTRQDKGGTGLGLAVSKRIVEEHGGTLTFGSEPGNGTTVTVRIPVQAQDRVSTGKTRRKNDKEGEKA